ncbi:MAG: DUF507 family protein [Sumerlaeia bacterium]
MRLSPNRMNSLSVLALRALKDSPHVDLRDADAVVAAVRRALQNNLREEDELEKQAEEMLAKHKTEILRTGGDYRRMVLEGKKTLAKKKGFVL